MVRLVLPGPAVVMVVGLYLRLASLLYTLYNANISLQAALKPPYYLRKNTLTTTMTLSSSSDIQPISRTQLSFLKT